MVICDQFRRILFISKAYSGHTHDFTIFKEIFAGFDFSAFRVHVDSGFVGLEKYVTPDFIFRPYKATKNNPLTDFQRAVNACLAHFRVRVEHAIAKAKAFFSLRIENRMRQKNKLDDAVAICIGLANFKSKLATC
ncbi:MAG: hypothetical protein EOP45_11130 [Sphingobacteriaceae bacterium]|nr:MAG: hypothetical protein EOP45_11130 [Sphingobacteriaceae bacterium]